MWSGGRASSIVEVGPTKQVLTEPLHPYTRALLDVMPETGAIERPLLAGEPPDPTRIPEGCRFHPRCPALADGRAAAAGVQDACTNQDPSLEALAEAHLAACHLAVRAARGFA